MSNIMTIKNNRKCALLLGLALTGGLSAAGASPARLASQSDLGKMWRTGGLLPASQVTVNGQGFKTAVSFTSSKKSAHSWDAQSGTNPKMALRQGDALLATFFVRSAQPATGGQIVFSVEGGPRYERSVWQDIKINSKWKKVSVPFKSKGTYGAGKWQITFKMGSMAQTVQIANFQMVKTA